jgi:hypothetical protein
MASVVGHLTLLFHIPRKSQYYYSTCDEKLDVFYFLCILYLRTAVWQLLLGVAMCNEFTHIDSCLCSSRPTNTTRMRMRGGGWRVERRGQKLATKYQPPGETVELKALCSHLPRSHSSTCLMCPGFCTLTQSEGSRKTPFLPACLSGRRLVVVRRDGKQSPVIDTGLDCSSRCLLTWWPCGLNPLQQLRLIKLLQRRNRHPGGLASPRMTEIQQSI